MVSKDFIDKVQLVCDSLESSRGAVNLFAILKMDDLTDKWTVVVGADWAASTPFQDVFAELRTDLINKLGDEMKTIARIGVFGLDDHLAQLLMQKYKTNDSITEDQQLNGNLIHEAYILKVVPPAK